MLLGFLYWDRLKSWTFSPSRRFIFMNAVLSETSQVLENLV